MSLFLQDKEVLFSYTVAKEDQWNWKITRFSDNQVRETEAATQSVLKKRCSENMQKIYRRIPMPKCDFNKVACCKATLLK